jgi:hypothetical protein
LKANLGPRRESAGVSSRLDRLVVRDEVDLLIVSFHDHMSHAGDIVNGVTDHATLELSNLVGRSVLNRQVRVGDGPACAASIF